VSYETQAVLTLEQHHQDSTDDQDETDNESVDQQYQSLFPSQATHLLEHAATHHITLSVKFSNFPKTGRPTPEFCIFQNLPWSTTIPESLAFLTSEMFEIFCKTYLPQWLVLHLKN